MDPKNSVNTATLDSPLNLPEAPEALSEGLKGRFFKRWMIFLKERFPLGTHLLLISGFAVSGAFISGWDKNLEGVVMAFFGFFLFFLELRVMDEFKDLRKDLVAHPERPLPRGLISVSEIRKAIQFIYRLMLVYSLTLVFVCNLLSGLIFLGISLYLWLMYREFFLGKTLSRFPMLYAFTHQIILIPLCLFTSATHHPAMFFDEATFFYSIAVFGAFFSFELCRKLDLSANPILMNYGTVYGPKRTSSYALILLGIAAYGSYLMKANFLWAAEGTVALCLLFYVFIPRKFKFAEAFAGLSLIVHIWSPTFEFVFKRLLGNKL